MNRLTPVLLSLALLLSVDGSVQADSASDWKIFGVERLSSSAAWNIHNGCRLTPATETDSARLEFPSGKWTALIGTLPLDKKMTGSFRLHLKCRWVGELSNIKATGLALLFLDADNKTIQSASVNRAIAAKMDWQDLEVIAPVPTGAQTVRFDISSHGGGTLEVPIYELYLDGVDLSAAALGGVEMPWLTVPGGQDRALKAPTDAAIVGASSADPYSFESPVWSSQPEYEMTTTSANKTPVNDVSARFQLAWTAEDLYVRFRAHDRVLNFKSEPRHERDCFEFFLMPASSRPEAGGVSSREQYSVTRSVNGETSANAPAITRLVKDGWEAILKISLQNDTRRISPFNGLTLTFNAGYQDANSVSQEHWLSFSKRDQSNASWRDPGLYVPLVFQTKNPVAYRPLWMGDRAEYNVDPKYAGRHNLIRGAADKANFSVWMKPATVKFDLSSDPEHPGFRLQFGSDARRAAAYSLTPFSVLPGETLVVEMEVRSPSSSGAVLPKLSFVSQSSWQIIEARTTSKLATDASWTPVTYTLLVPERFRDHLRSGRILMQFPARSGQVVEVANIRVTRRMPADFDARLSTPTLYSHFWSGEKNVVRFQFASGEARKSVIRAEVRDYFSGKTLLTQEWKTDLAAGESGFDWEISTLPNGFFNILLKVRTADGKFLADRELAVSKGVKASQRSAFSGLFFDSNLSIPAPQKVEESLAMLRDLGIGMANWLNFYLNDENGRDLSGDSLEIPRAFKRAGLITGTIVERGGYSLNREWQPTDMRPFYERMLSRSKGLVDFWNFANEPNLPMGWNPVPDGREWAMFYRGFYNAVKRYSPQARPILGCFNQIPEPFMRAAAEQNQNSFADGVMGVHLYGLEPNGEGFTHLLEGRQQMEAIHPGWEAWDTESGLVYLNYRSILDLQSKKMPILLCAGFTRSFFYLETDMLFPLADSTPLLPMESFKNRFYLDARPIGRVTLAGGKVHVYLFQHSDGTGLAAFWNTVTEEHSIELPIRGAGECLDVFGNRIATLTSGNFSITLKDRMVNYVRGIDLDTMRHDSTFIEAFHSRQSAPAKDVGYSTGVYMDVPDVTRIFDREIAVGQPSVLSIRVCNETSSPQKVTLTGSGPEGLRIAFSEESIALKTGESCSVLVTLQADRRIDRQPLKLNATLESGDKLLPLVMVVKTTPPVSVEGFSRSLELRNNTSSVADVELVPSKAGYLFKPDVFKQRLQPGAVVTLPVSIVPVGKADDFNRPMHYDVHVKWADGDYTKDVAAILFQAQKETGVEVDLNRLPYSAAGNNSSAEKFQANYNLLWTTEGLRIVARVEDGSSVQDREGGDVKNGGDCMLVAFERGPGKYLECGFASSRGKPVAYTWDGNYGLETAKSFPGTVRRIDRDSVAIYYDVIIPQALIAPIKAGEPIAMSIVFLNRGTDGKTQKIELGQGIVPDRISARMGQLLPKP